MRERSAPLLTAMADELHAPLLSHVRKHVRNASDAEDITQETWARTTAAAAAGNPIANVRAYLYRVARNLMIDHGRRADRAIEIGGQDDLIATLPDPRPDPESELITAEQLARMDRIIAAMPGRARQVFRLSRLEGQSFAEIGRALGISRQTVQDHMTRALLALQLAADGDF